MAEYLQILHALYKSSVLYVWSHFHGTFSFLFFNCIFEKRSSSSSYVSLWMKKVTLLFTTVVKLKKRIKTLDCDQCFTFRLILGTFSLSVVDQGRLLVLFLGVVDYLLRSRIATNPNRFTAIILNVVSMLIPDMK